MNDIEFELDEIIDQIEKNDAISINDLTQILNKTQIINEIIQFKLLKKKVTFDLNKILSEIEGIEDISKINDLNVLNEKLKQINTFSMRKLSTN